MAEIHGADDHSVVESKGERTVGLQRTRAQLLRKVDLYVLPITTLMYLMSGLDRSNLGNAKIAGLTSDLHLSPQQYAVAASMIYASYVTCEIPSNLMLKKLTPSKWLPFICLAWGIVTLGTGFVRSYPSLVVVRLILGFTESGLFPGLTFLLTLWYPRHSIVLRFGIFYGAGNLAGAFGGLLSRALVEMNGVGGLEGWRWIFIIEGLITVVIAVAAFLVARFLSPSEKDHLIEWLHEDSGGESHEFRWPEVAAAFRMPVVWTAAVLCMTVALPCFSFALFLPSIVQNLGYSATRAQLMTVPPYVVGCATTLVATYWSDRLKQRASFICGSILVGMTGYIMLVAAPSNSVRYAGVFFVAGGLFPATAINVPWLSNNLRGHSRRATGAAFQLAVGQFGGIAGSFIYPDTNGPRYIMGHSIALGSLVVALLTTFLQYAILRRENAKLEGADGTLVESTVPTSGADTPDKTLAGIASPPSSLHPVLERPPGLGYIGSRMFNGKEDGAPAFRFTL
ncbi:MFS general substrate transporter [Auriculariales sp. MPI-PUGE-AT-0066]|nr:MFS general substrate transporter [Auriculariales sp. MPI-PUGE-AT-0066]